MMIVAMAFAILSALLHVFIFYMESIAWTSERTRATFNMSAEGPRLRVRVPGRWPRPHALWDRLDARRSTAPLHHLAG